VASPDGGAATGDTASAGKKVVKILTGFKPHEVVTVTLHSAPQTVGTFTADASGTVRVEFTVPAGTPAGTHTLVYEGNMGTYFQESLTVAAASGTGDNLAYTGASVAMPLGLGAGALALGGGLVFMTRRRNAQAAEASQA
jgi:LPXTG-motif cell wall-anchored protein